MKRLLTLLLSIIAVMLCLVGCNQEKSTVEFSSYMIGSLIGQEEKTEEDKLAEMLLSSEALYAYKIDKQETNTTQIVYVWDNLLRRELRLDIRQIYFSVPDKDKSVTIQIYEDSTVKIDNKNIDFEATSDLSFAVLRAIFPKESTVNSKEFRDIFREMAIRLETLEQFGDTEVIAIQTVTSSELLFGNTEDKEVKLVMPVDDTHTEHTYEWVGNEGGHQKVYTCGCEYPDIVELHSDNNGDYQCDVCGWFMDETLPEWADSLIQAYEEKYPQAGKVTILHYCGTYESGALVAMIAGSDESFDDAMWTETVADYDFNYSNGNRIRALYEGEFYTLTTAYENGYLTKENIADIHRKWELDYIDDVVTEYIFTLIGGIEMSNIQKIETVKYSGSISPIDRAPVEYKTSTLATDIENVYNWLSVLKENVTKIPDVDAMLAGSSVTELYVYTTNNNCFKFSDVGRNYLHFYGTYYEQEGETPEIVGETITYKFESYYDEAGLYINDEKVKDYTFDFDELVCIEKDFETSGNPYKLVASIGSLYLYDEKHFIRNDIQYEIVGEFDFSQIYEDFPIESEDDLSTQGVLCEISEDGTYAQVVGYEGAASIVCLPKRYQGIPITHIARSAFEKNEIIQEIVFPNTLQIIEAYAFSLCPNLLSVHLPNALETIEAGAFFGCKELKTVQLNSGLKWIGESAFEYSGIESIVIPASVETLKGNAFANCLSLKTVLLEQDSQLLQLYNFLFYGDTALESVVFGDNSSLTRIGNSTFYGCSSLKMIEIPEGVEEIDYAAFEGCLLLKSVTFPMTLRTLSSHSFYNCEGLSEIIISKATTSINHNAFTGCDALMKIAVEQGNTVYHASGNCIIETAAKKLLIGCTGSILPQDDSVTEIGTWAFGDNPSLKKIEISQYVKKIALTAFYQCGGLEEIVVNENNPVFHEDGNCLIQTAEKKLLRFCANSTIPADGSVTQIQDGAFSGCTMKKLYIPACINTIAISDPQITGLESIVVEEGNEYYYSEGNCLIASLSKTLYVGCKNSVIPTGVEKIKSFAFRFSEVQSINIPVSVTEIQSFAFANCEKLTEIRYEGTIEQWLLIDKASSWDSNTAEYVVICSNGTLHSA